MTLERPWSDISGSSLDDILLSRLGTLIHMKVVAISGSSNRNFKQIKRMVEDKDFESRNLWLKSQRDFVIKAVMLRFMWKQ